MRGEQRFEFEQHSLGASWSPLSIWITIMAVYLYRSYLFPNHDGLKPKLTSLVTGEGWASCWLDCHWSTWSARCLELSWLSQAVGKMVWYRRTPSVKRLWRPPPRRSFFPNQKANAWGRGPRSSWSPLSRRPQSTGAFATRRSHSNSGR